VELEDEPRHPTPSRAGRGSEVESLVAASTAD
jgi:hypothetical protein